MTNTRDDELGELLSAYLDGELGEQETAFVEQTVLRDAAARALLDELRMTSELVGSLPRHQAPDSICQDVTGHLEREELLGDADRPMPIADRERRSWFALLSMAAMFALVATSAFWMFRSAGRQGGDGQDRIAKASLKQRAPEVDRLAAVSSDLRKKAATSRDAPLSRNRKPADIAVGLDADRKLAMGEPVDSLRGHAFEAETVRLRMFVGDADQQKSMAAMLASHLSQHRVVDLQKPMHGRGRERAKARGFYLEGTRGRNFSDRGGRQILLRVPVDTLDDWLADLSKSGQGSERIELASGAVVSRGVQDVRARLQQMAQMAALSPDAAEPRTNRRAQRRRARAKRSSSPPTESPRPATSFIKELLKVMDEHAIAEKDGVEKDSVEKSMAEAGGAVADSATTRDEEGPGAAVPTSVAADGSASSHGKSQKSETARASGAVQAEMSAPLADARPGRAGLDRESATHTSGVRFVTLVIELNDELNGETLPPATAASPPASSAATAKGRPTGNVKDESRAKRSGRSKPAGKNRPASK